MSPSTLRAKGQGMSKEQKGPLQVSGDLQPSPRRFSRRDFIFGAGATAGLWWLADKLNLGQDAKAIKDEFMAQLQPKDRVDTAALGNGNDTLSPGASDSRGEYTDEADALDRTEPESQTETSVEEIPNFDTREFHISEFSLWDRTVNLASGRYPMATIVVPNHGYVIAGGATIYTPSVREFNANTRFSHSFAAGKRPTYRYNPHTYLHSGHTEGHFLAAGNLEVALRTAEALNMTIPQTIAASENNFKGARVFILQALDPSAFEAITSWSNVDRALSKFYGEGGNSVELEFDRLVRVPREKMAEFKMSLGPSHGDPDPLLASYAAAGQGWGDWTEADRSSLWHIQFCAGSAIEDLKAEREDFRINAARWVAGFKPLGGVANFDPFTA